jgi:hypothetical protein
MHAAQHAQQSGLPGPDQHSGPGTASRGPPQLGRPMRALGWPTGVTPRRDQSVPPARFDAWCVCLVLRTAWPVIAWRGTGDEAASPESTSNQSRMRLARRLESTRTEVTSGVEGQLAGVEAVARR